MKVEIGSNEAGQRLDRFLRKWLKDMPLNAIYKSIRKGDVKVNGKKAKENYSLTLGDIVETRDITTEIKQDNGKFIQIKSNLKITYEDENMVLVEKWPGVLVHSDEKDGEPTLTDYVLSYLNEKGDYTPENEITFSPAPCNRLDRNTSGIVIYGKNFESLQLLNEMIRNREIRKFYSAIVKGRIADGIYTAYILKNEDKNISKIYDNPHPGAKPISMDVKSVESCGSYSFIDIELLTGRSHQLRAHLSHLGNPILGDTKYGDSKINSYFRNKYGLNYQYLYAYKLIFKDCPDKFSKLNNKTIAEALPPVFKKIKKDIFKFE